MKKETVSIDFNKSLWTPASFCWDYLKLKELFCNVYNGKYYIAIKIDNSWNKIYLVPAKKVSDGEITVYEEVDEQPDNKYVCDKKDFKQVFAACLPINDAEYSYRKGLAILNHKPEFKEYP